MEKGAFAKFLGGIYANGYIMTSLALGHELGLIKFICEADEPVSLEHVSTTLKLKQR